LSSYELMMTFNPNLGEEKIFELVSKVEEKIKSFGGEIEKTDKWGVKKLASRFRNAKKLTQGYYVMVYFSGETTVPVQTQAFLKVTENIVRATILKAVPKQEVEVAEKPAESKEEEAVEAVNVGEIKEVKESSGQS
jgi:small subunit ribosomal protein S6